VLQQLHIVLGRGAVRVVLAFGYVGVCSSDATRSLRNSSNGNKAEQQSMSMAEQLTGPAAVAAAVAQLHAVSLCNVYAHTVTYCEDPLV
jgi:hypothetical protein